MEIAIRISIILLALTASIVVIFSSYYFSRFYEIAIGFKEGRLKKKPSRKAFAVYIIIVFAAIIWAAVVLLEPAITTEQKEAKDFIYATFLFTCINAVYAFQYIVRLIWRKGKESKPGPSKSVFVGFTLFVVLFWFFTLPNAMKFSARGKQSEAKTNLGAIYMAQQVYFSNANTYAGELAAFQLLGWEPAGQNRYAYYCGEDMIEKKLSSGGVMIPFPGDWSYQIRPGSSATGFTCMAVGNIDADDTPDVWSINDRKILINELDDVSR